MNLDELLIANLQNLADAEKLLVAGLPAMVEAASNAELQTALAEHLKQTQTQALRISDACTCLGVRPETTICKPMAALVADAAEAALTEPAGPIRDIAILGAAERVEHFEIGAYFAAISLAKTLAYGDAANLLVENLLEEQKAADHLTKISKVLLKQAQEEAAA